MPNWCDNTLYLSHKDPKMVDKAIEGWKNNKFFGTLVPEPDYTKVKVKPTFPMNMATGQEKPEFVEPDQAWWDWRLQNWASVHIAAIKIIYPTLTMYVRRYIKLMSVESVPKQTLLN